MPTIIREYRESPHFYLLSYNCRHQVYLILFIYYYMFRYTQGMSDLLAPVLCEIKNEAESFWCFVGLMQRAIFVCTPTDNDIDKNLVRITHADLYIEHFSVHKITRINCIFAEFLKGIDKNNGAEILRAFGKTCGCQRVAILSPLDSVVSIRH